MHTVPFPWQNLPQGVQTVLHRLHTAGFEAVLVGGCVRDKCLNRPLSDYDMATQATPEEMLSAFSGLRVLPTGLPHGTLTVVLPDLSVEVTTYRVDGDYADARHPDAVSFTRTLREDVARRDLTINALAWLPDFPSDAEDAPLQNGSLVDCVGGLSDLAQGVIRCVGDASCRFSEDALRILRALRFCAQLGFAADEDCRQAALALRESLRKIAPERIRVELKKLLLGRHAPALLREEGTRPILSVCLPCLSRLTDAQYAAALERLALVNRAYVDPSPACPLCAALPGHREAASWAALLLDAGEEALQETLTLLRCDKATLSYAARCLHAALSPLDSEYAVRRLCGALGKACVRDALLLRYHAQPPQAEQGLRWIERALRLSLPCTVADLPVNGRDLLSRGLTGKEVGQALEQLLDEAIRKSCQPPNA